ncbi:MAG: ATP-binding protein [Candidatus Dojkabacteria bacterium]|nr:ATP-binding protein [Candidatus Dojkabacteria bacterium]
MRITVLSGKGGVGKSMIASSLAILFSKNKKVIAVDCDVDAPNLALWLGIDTSILRNAAIQRKISTIEKPVIDRERCRVCGKCAEKCNFDALKMNNGKVDLIKYKCEGCGLCKIICPFGAIQMRAVDNCTLSHYETKYGFPVIQGQIEPGEAESGEAVTEIRKYAKALGDRETMYIQDAAAGIGCPVIASIVGSDYVVAVAEPSKSSFSDLKRVLKVVDKFRIPFGVAVNKYDLNERISKTIKDFANDRYLGGVSYDRKIVESLVALKPALETSKAVSEEFKGLYENVVKRVGE